MHAITWPRTVDEKRPYSWSQQPTGLECIGKLGTCAAATRASAIGRALFLVQVSALLDLLGFVCVLPTLEASTHDFG